jgi:hypothetical protein
MSSEESEKNNSKRKEPKEEETEDYDEKSEQIKEKAERAREKAERLKEKAKRINISVSPEMSEEWKDWSKELGSSVSELVRKSMKFMKNNIGDLSKLEAIGGTIERAVKESGLEDLGEKIEREIKGVSGKPKIHVNISHDEDKERIKKRVRGLIKLQKNLPIDKLAQALNRTNEDAENLIYELVDDGIEGTLEEGIFKFTSSPDEVISKINDLIDKI